jgi:hypothetical protein
MAQSEPVVIEESNDEVEQGGDARREMSTIVFPYQDLDEAIEVAKAIHALHGSSCTTEQIAAHLQLSPKSSGFKMKITTAKTFGLVTTGQGTVNLTPLGTQMCDHQQEKTARATAFLRVPLYNKVHEHFKGAVLPPPVGLEAALGTFGVAQKQRERARQVLQRSAQQAGFFQFGTDRLVMPPITQSTPAPALNPPDTNTEKKKNSKDEEDEKPLHPFIKGLLDKLPPADSEWANDKRAKWLQAAVNIFDLMYTESEDEAKRTITIGFQKDSAKQ